MKTSNSYSIYLDQPLARQLKFISLLLPSVKRVGVLSASFSAEKITTLILEASKLNLTIFNQYVQNKPDLPKKLNRLIKNIDVLFSLPEQMIHNSSSIPYLLLSTYRYNIPLIGFSKAYVNAGAIAAIYSSPGQITKQISELVKQLTHQSLNINNHYFPPKYYSIAINHNVANSLGLHLPDIQKIKSKLLQSEK